MRRIVLTPALVAALAFVWLAVAAPPAFAGPGRAEVILDARSGEALYTRNADTKLHPASLTKMMTLYMVFEAVEDGRLDLDQRVKVSRAAARQPASKVGFRAGQRVRVRDLIRSAAVRSANDSAVVLAEAVAGSEARFAERMTRRARQLGMTRTRFRNASGLTAKGHLSTARDMALLGLRLFYDFPEYYNLFGRRSTPAFGKTIWNTNRLLGSYAGADGIKTGYTRAAGWNLVSSARRGGKHVIVSLFGGESAAARNKRVAALMDRGFRLSPRTPRGRVADLGVGLAALRSPTPTRRPGGGASLFAARAAAAVADALSPAAAQAATVDPRAALADAGTALAPLRGPAPMRRPGADPVRVAVIAPQAPQPAPTPTPSLAASAAAGAWSVALGPYRQREAAVANLAAAALGSMPALAEAGREVSIATGSGGSLFDARLTGLDRSVAVEACAALRGAGQACRPVAPAR